MPHRAADLVEAFETREITFREFVDSVEALTPELVEFAAVISSTIWLPRVRDERRRRSARRICLRRVTLFRVLN